MREYRSADIRNVAVVGHGASGKTTLVDALAFVSGSSKRHGSVKDGTALTDHTAEEIERGFSINLGCAFAEWMDTKINLIDTPGYLDFQGDALAGLAAADGALVRRQRDGRRRGRHREDVPRGGRARRTRCCSSSSMMDKEHANFDADLPADQGSGSRRRSSRSKSRSATGAEFRGIINLFAQEAPTSTSRARSGEYDEADIPGR